MKRHQIHSDAISRAAARLASVRDELKKLMAMQSEETDLVELLSLLGATNEDTRRYGFLMRKDEP